MTNLPVLTCPDCGLWITMLTGHENDEYKQERVQLHKKRGECKHVVGN